MFCVELFALARSLAHLRQPIATPHHGMRIAIRRCAQSESIGQSAYFARWHESGKYTKRITAALRMIMMRSMRACKLTAGKFASVDLPTFLSVCDKHVSHFLVEIRAHNFAFFSFFTQHFISFNIC